MSNWMFGSDKLTRAQKIAINNYTMGEIKPFKPYKPPVVHDAQKRVFKYKRYELKDIPKENIDRFNKEWEEFKKNNPRQTDQIDL